MNRFTRIILFVLGLSVVANEHLAAFESHEPRNLALAIKDIEAYVDTGLYASDIQRVCEEASDWIENRSLRKHPNEKLAVILDVDETALSNLPYMRSVDFGYEPVSWKTWVRAAHCPPVEPVRKICRDGYQRGIAVFFLTYRSESTREFTEKNLRDAGFGAYAGLYCKTDNSKETPQQFKTAKRKFLTDQGYTIIANIGDQVSDLDGGYSERSFKLPSPFYITK